MALCFSTCAHVCVRECVRRLACTRQQLAPSRRSLHYITSSCSYIIDEGIVYLTLVDAGYPKKLALRYLHDVHTALVAELKMQWPSTWQHELRIISNAYALQKFGTFLHALVGYIPTV